MIIYITKIISVLQEQINIIQITVTAHTLIEKKTLCFRSDLFEGDTALEHELLQSIIKFNRVLTSSLTEYPAAKLRPWPRAFPYDLHKLSKLY